MSGSTPLLPLYSFMGWAGTAGNVILSRVTVDKHMEFNFEQN